MNEDAEKPEDQAEPISGAADESGEEGASSSSAEGVDDPKASSEEPEGEVEESAQDSPQGGDEAPSSEDTIESDDDSEGGAEEALANLASEMDFDDLPAGEDDSAAETGDASTTGSVNKLSAEQRQDLERILKIPIDVAVVVAERRIPMGGVLDFLPGQLLEFSKVSDEQLELYVGEQWVARGEVVIVNERFGLRIKEVRPVKDTIKTLADI